MPHFEDIRKFVGGDERGILSGISGFTRARLIAEESAVSMKNVGVTAWLATFLVPLFLVLDYLVYPEHFASFLVLRMGCVASILVVLYCSKQKWAKRFYRFFAVLLPFIVASYIALMMYQVKDPGTPYYAGLTLCLVGVGALFNWTHREAIFTSVVVLVMYLAACGSSFSYDNDAKTIGYFINNLLFIIATGILIVSGSYVHYGGRVSAFLAKTQLRKNQAELERINRELGETLSALQETESQLIQADKMAFLGQMSAGVIHEIGNPLNFSNQALFILRKKMKKTGATDGEVEVIDDLQEGLDRIKGIVSELREFSHIGAGYGSSFRFSESVDSALRMLGQQIEDSDTEIAIDIDATIEIQGVKNQITQVMVNLIHNALQAMDKEKKPGTLTIVGGSLTGGGVCLTVADNGPGISPENVSKLFDPFFTTKDPGEGTGLGLSVSYRIIESHGGTIRAESAPGGGAVFTVTLPSDIPAKADGDKLELR